jgi:hypothetical protein
MHLLQFSFGIYKKNTPVNLHNVMHKNTEKSTKYVATASQNLPPTFKFDRWF